MDLEHLTKHQIVLLTLLVSFVTSIATGIVTVTLVNQAPPSVSRTINQIVERTVETVSPAAAPTVTTQKTVVVSSDDAAVEAIASVQKSVIRIVQKGGTDLVARGVIVGHDGTALTDADALTALEPTSFEAILPGGVRVPLTIPDSQATSSPLLIVNVAVGTTTGWAPSAVVDPSSLALGQSVIRIGGVGADSVAQGVISTLPQQNNSDIEASVVSGTPGSVLISVFGDIIGLSTSESQNRGNDFYTLAALPAAATSTPSNH